MELSIISLAIALLAVIVGPFISYKIASKQIKAQYLIGEKQKAVFELKEILQNILFNRAILVAHAIKYRRFALESINEYEQNTETLFKDLIMQQSRLLLLLDLENQKQKELYNIISASIDPLEDNSMNWENIFTETSQRIAFISREVIKEFEKKIEEEL